MIEAALYLLASIGAVVLCIVVPLALIWWLDRRAANKDRLP